MSGDRRRKWWPEWFDDVMDDLFRQMEEMMKEIEERGTLGPFIYGFSMSKKPGEDKFEIREFGNIRPRAGEIKLDKREPLVDVIDSKGEIRVIAEMPGVEKKDINVSVIRGGRGLRIEAKTGDREYSTVVDLPAAVESKESRATYKNGVLEVILRKREAEEEGESISVS